MAESLFDLLSAFSILVFFLPLQEIADNGLIALLV